MQEWLGSPLCSRNARPPKALVGRAQFGANQAPPPGVGVERKGKVPDGPLCSLRPHDKAVVPQCAQSRTIWPPPPMGDGKREGRGKQGRLAIPCARATRGRGLPSLDARTLGKRQAASPNNCG